MAENWVSKITNYLVNVFIKHIFSDQFVLEENGYGRVVGRIKDMIIRGGENIFPVEIENHLNTHPDILETHVSIKSIVGCIIRIEIIRLAILGCRYPS